MTVYRIVGGRGFSHMPTEESLPSTVKVEDMHKESSRISFMPECTETDSDIMDAFAQLYSKVGLMQQASMERVRLRDAAIQISQLSRALELGADPMKVMREMDKIEIQIDGRLRR